MLTTGDCLSQADHSATVAGRLSDGSAGAGPISLQWAVVCVFYAGIYYVNAYLGQHIGVVPQRHEDREQRVSMHMEPSVFYAFRELRTICDAARYRPVIPTGIDYQTSLRHLEVIRTYVCNELGC